MDCDDEAENITIQQLCSSSWGERDREVISVPSRDVLSFSDLQGINWENNTTEFMLDDWTIVSTFSPFWKK